MTEVRGQRVKFRKGKEPLSNFAKLHSFQTAPCLGWQVLGNLGAQDTRKCAGCQQAPSMASAESN